MARNAPSRSDLIASGALVDLTAQHTEACARAGLSSGLVCSALVYERTIAERTDYEEPAPMHPMDDATPDERAERLVHAFRRTFQTQGKRQIERQRPRTMPGPIAFALPVRYGPDDVREVAILYRLDVDDVDGPAIRLELAPDSVDA